jgi:hypothetical protein
VRLLTDLRFRPAVFALGDTVRIDTSLYMCLRQTKTLPLDSTPDTLEAFRLNYPKGHIQILSSGLPEIVLNTTGYCGSGVCGTTAVPDPVIRATKYSLTYQPYDPPRFDATDADLLPVCSPSQVDALNYSELSWFEWRSDPAASCPLPEASRLIPVVIDPSQPRTANGKEQFDEWGDAYRVSYRWTKATLVFHPSCPLIPFSSFVFFLRHLYTPAPGLTPTTLQPVVWGGRPFGPGPGGLTETEAVQVVGTMPEFFDPRASLSVKVIPPVALASPWRVLTKNFVAI